MTDPLPPLTRLVMTSETLHDAGLESDAEVLLDIHRKLVLELDRHRGIRHRLWILLGREDGAGLDIELIDAVADAVSSRDRLRADKRAIAYAANDLGGIVEGVCRELGVNRDAGLDVIIPAIRKLRDPS